MNSKNIGDSGELLVVEYLKAQSYEIIERNWRTRWCEIDIIARKNGTIHFVEVKYRGSEVWGDGFEYITTKKIKQMQFAAELWMQSDSSEDDVVLSAAAVNDKGEVRFLEQI